MSANSHNYSPPKFGGGTDNHPFTQSSSQDAESHNVLMGVTLTAGIVLAAGLGFCYIRRWKERKNLEYLRLKKTKMQHGDASVLDIDASTSSSAIYETAATTLPDPSDHTDEGVSFTFTYEQLELATNNFDPGNLIGQGGFGYVYKGSLKTGEDQDDREVAVKRLMEGTSQGEDEFQSEILTLSPVRHVNIVSLLGYCIDGEERLLVYDLVHNKSLEHHLFAKDAPTLEWPDRMKIAIGSAKGIAYLHESCRTRILHRDIKASNILLGNDFEAKVTDFGLAKLIKDSESYVSTRVAGSAGYMDPEYRSTGHLTDKSDMYSFGMLLLVIITGKKAHVIDTEQAKLLLRRGLDKNDNFRELVDPHLKDKYDITEMRRMAVCAARIIYCPSKERPKMSRIVTILELEGEPLPDELNKAMKYLKRG